MGDSVTGHDFHSGLTGVRAAAAILFLCLAAIATGAQAADPAAKAGLYDVSVPVKNQSAEARQEGFRQGVDLLLGRLTGRRQPEGSAVLKAARASARELVAQFFYSQSADSSQAAGPVLHIGFRKSAMRRFLRQQGLPFWGEVRPSVLLWVVQESGGLRQFVGDRHLSQLKKLQVKNKLERAASDWGLPLSWPLFDFQDLEAVHVSDVWGGFVDPVRQASARYGADEILLLRLHSSGSERWDAHGHFVFRGKVLNWKTSRASIDELAQFLMEKMAATMADYYGVAPGKEEDRGSIVLRVDNVRSAASYADILRLTETATAVRKVETFEVQGDSLLIRLVLDGTVSQLDSAMLLNPHMVHPGLMEAKESRGQQKPDLHYRWRP